MTIQEKIKAEAVIRAIAQPTIHPRRTNLKEKHRILTPIGRGSCASVRLRRITPRTPSLPVGG